MYMFRSVTVPGFGSPCLNLIKHFSLIFIERVANKSFGKSTLYLKIENRNTANFQFLTTFQHNRIEINYSIFNILKNFDYNPECSF